jgi:hypothetical protein
LWISFTARARVVSSHIPALTTHLSRLLQRHRQVWRSNYRALNQYFCWLSCNWGNGNNWT